MADETLQEELFTDRYCRLIEKHQKLQQTHSAVWAANERRKLVMDEYERAIIILLKRSGQQQIVLRPSEIEASKVFMLHREQHSSDVVFKVKP